MTPLLKVLADFCAVYIDDIRLEEKAVQNPPLYFRQMYQYFRPAISLFTLPSEMQEYLLKGFVEPQFDDCVVTLEQDETYSFILDLDPQYKGYDLCSCFVKENYEFKKINIEYNPLGSVIVKATLPKGTELYFDFYADGFFKKDLSYEIMDILGTCFELVWQTRFNNDWLSNVSKLDDRSFTEQNRANKENADTERIREIKSRLAGKMRRFEQNKYYDMKVKPLHRLDI